MRNGTGRKDRNGALPSMIFNCHGVFATVSISWEHPWPAPAVCDSLGVTAALAPPPPGSFTITHKIEIGVRYLATIASPSSSSSITVSRYWWLNPSNTNLLSSY